MATRHDQQGAGKNVSLRRLLISTAAVPAAVLALTMAFPQEASAADIDYAFSAGATVTFAANQESITGSFIFDTVSSAIVSANVTIKPLAPEAGAYNNDPTATGDRVFAASNAAETATLVLAFADSFEDDAYDPLTKNGSEG